MRNLVAVTFLLLFVAVATALSLQTALDPASTASGCAAPMSRNAVSAQNPDCPFMEQGRCPFTHPRTVLPRTTGRLRSLEI